MTDKTDNTRINFVLPVALSKGIKKIAGMKGQSLSEFIRQALKEHARKCVAELKADRDKGIQ